MTAARMTPEIRDELVCGLSRDERATLRAALDAADLREAVAEVVAAARPTRPQPAATPDKPTYSVADAAEYLQCSADQVYTLIHAHELRASRIGKGFAIRAEELERYLIDQELAVGARRVELQRSKRGHTNAAAVTAASVAS